MEILYAYEEMPRGEENESSIFLAGPTPREDGVTSWREEALQILEKKGFEGYVFVPEPRDGEWCSDYDGQIDWEQRYLEAATVIIFWIPRDLDSLPGFTTNIEFGMYVKSRKTSFGAPEDAPRMSYIWYCARKFNFPSATTLDGVIVNSLQLIETLSRDK